MNRSDVEKAIKTIAEARRSTNGKKLSERIEEMQREVDKVIEDKVIESEAKENTSGFFSDGLPYASLISALDIMRSFKPNDNSQKDRSYASAITDLEKVLAYFKTYIIGSK